MSGKKIEKLKDIELDPRNANRGTARGYKQITGSIQRNGFGRSGLLDKNGRAIAGNKTTEASAEVFGVEAEPIIVQTDGKRPVYVQRVDLDLDDPNPNNPARRLAYEDNLASSFSFELNAEQVMADMEAGFDFEAIDVTLEDVNNLTDWTISELSNPPSLDELEEEYGEPEERDFWPYIRVQVSPETMEQWETLMNNVTETEDEAKKVEIILGRCEQ